MANEKSGTALSMSPMGQPPARRFRMAMLSPLPAGRGKLPESGVAAYAEALASHLSDYVDLTVLAQADCPLRTVGNASVVATWTPDRQLPRQLSRALEQFGFDLLHVQHEFNLYGGLTQGGLLTMKLMSLRRRGTRVVTTVHGVVPPSEIGRDFLRRNSLPRSIGLVRTAFKIAYKAISASSDALIVHHEYFRQVFIESYGVSKGKIWVVKPGLPTIAATPSGRGSRVLVLGFLTGYKLPELVVDVAESGLADTVFHFCVGLNPRIKDQAYLARYARLEERVKALKSRAIWSGYVPDQELGDVFAAASILILPYTECVSSSAVAALAERFGVATIHSRPLRPLFGPGPLEFELEAKSLAAALRRATTVPVVPPNGLFTAWETAASATRDVWDKVLVGNANRHSYA